MIIPRHLLSDFLTIYDFNSSRRSIISSGKKIFNMSKRLSIKGQRRTYDNSMQTDGFLAWLMLKKVKSSFQFVN